jgi:hypothetical protein
MWLQRVIFNLQARLLKLDEEPATRDAQASPPRPQRQTERARLIENRLLDLDRRLALLR